MTEPLTGDSNVESLKQALKKMEPLGGRLSALLRGRVVSGDHVWFRLAFLAHKLSGIVAELQRQLEKLPIYDDPSKPETALRLQELTHLAEKDVGQLLDGWEQASRCSLPWRKVRGETIERSLSWLVSKGLLVTHVLTCDANDDAVSASHPELLPQEDRLLGVDDATEKLRAWLTNKDDGGLKVASIVGRAGVGKTALAMELYGQISDQFDCCVTARMSRRPHKQRFLQHIIDQISIQIQQEAEHPATNQMGRVRPMNKNTKRDMPTGKDIPSTEQMVSSIKKSLENKRYLVVIDDIWDTSELGLKSSPLQENKIMKSWEPEETKIKEDQKGKRNKDHLREKEINEYRKEDEANRDNKDKLLSFLDDGEFKSWTSSDNKNKDWEIIKHAFPDDRCGSRIMVTTRISSIARFCCSSTWSNGLVHEVKPLNDVDSERLFLRNAFGRENGCPPPTRQACDEILRICEGIPMFVAGMGKTVRKKLREQRSAVCDVQQVPQLMEEFEKELSYSYNDLFYGLELLPLCMSMALVQQKGCMIDKERLIRAWVREGLIYSDHWGECEEKAEHCFSELVDRNIIRLATFPGMTETCLCQVDPFLLQFLVSKSGKVNFVTTGTGNMLSQQAGKKNSRIVVVQKQHPSHHPEMLLEEEEMDLSSTLSLTISGAAQRVCLYKVKLGSLVVLDLEGWNKLADDDLVRVCENIGKLKYLSVRNTRITKLPRQIQLLRRLRELDIGGCTRIRELPLQVCMLTELQALDLRNTRVRQLPEQITGLQGLRRLLLHHQLDGTEMQQLPERIRLMAELRTLATVDLSCCSARFLGEALGGLSSLRVLSMTWYRHQCANGAYTDALWKSIGGWKRLRSLTIHCQLGCSMEFLATQPRELTALPREMEMFKVTVGRFPAAPQWIRELSRLVFLQITVCSLAPGGMEILGSLPMLECLILGLDYLPSEAAVIHGGGFRRLLRLSIDCRQAWLDFKQGAMPRMTHLEIRLSRVPAPASRESVPSGMGYLISLEHVAVRYHAWYLNSCCVKATVDAMRKQVTKFQYLVKLVINGIQDI
ncbi:unnamed protein product [Alopecurus aequalis]